MESSHAEIAYFELEFLYVEKEVGRLDISMDEVSSVQVSDSMEQLESDELPLDGVERVILL